MHFNLQERKPKQQTRFQLLWPNKMKNDGRKSIRYEPIHCKFLFFVHLFFVHMYLAYFRPWSQQSSLALPPFLLMAWANLYKFSLENGLSPTSISLLRFSKMSLDIMLSVWLTFEGNIPNTSDSFCGKGRQYITMAMASSGDTFKEFTLWKGFLQAHDRAYVTNLR